jgi:S-ribosylhomocysteine lyase LuxS involved in autoinducer biosynthesis
VPVEQWARRRAAESIEHHMAFNWREHAKGRQVALVFEQVPGGVQNGYAEAMLA